MTAQSALHDRLSGYWKLELGNATLVPATILLLAWSFDGRLGWLTAASFVPMIWLLLLGGFYWRGKLLSLRGDDAPLCRALAHADRFQLPIAAASFGALLAAITSWIVDGIGVSTWDRGAATASAILAVLEYINYYHRQLQHFDHVADWKRLMGGKGFRPSQMSRDLARYRAGRV
ncbi:hypothetical protein [Paraurantiacibacter namhicola]|uniref:Uncharacterized protein n=1 Tax=Paraurantiacibacter namhicola TaxID=645517 RepID=A0A1C7D8L1_9SPHN|nr:hypothetical protein [Paraurantiacibacter namhicola]ANU07814.1 hypothetical protein A6F65_01511 [Paraurantiacibacter namhicola]